MKAEREFFKTRQETEAKRQKGERIYYKLIKGYYIVKMNETSIKTENIERISKTVLGMFDSSTVTTIAIWIVGVILVFNLSTMTVFAKEINLIIILLVTLYIGFMVVTMQQTTIIHLLKERKEK